MRRDSSQIDLAAVNAVADRISDIADLIDGAVGKHLAQLTFNGARAGREHASRGDALRAGLDRLAAEVSQYSRAAVEIAVTLRAGVDRYSDAEAYAVARIA
jgi:hypothetical protein